jgi:hypothetical protein
MCHFYNGIHAHEIFFKFAQRRSLEILKAGFVVRILRGYIFVRVQEEGYWPLVILTVK